MTLREIISNETITILTEEKVSSLVEYIIKRYDGSRKHYNDHRIEVAYKSENKMDKRLYGDDNRAFTKTAFYKECVAKFDQKATKEKIKIPRHEFIITLNNYLSFFGEDGKLLPRTSK